jgi:hypothetical protein
MKKVILKIEVPNSRAIAGILPVIFHEAGGKMTIEFQAPDEGRIRNIRLHLLQRGVKIVDVDSQEIKSKKTPETRRNI